MVAKQGDAFYPLVSHFVGPIDDGQVGFEFEWAESEADYRAGKVKTIREYSCLPTPPSLLTLLHEEARRHGHGPLDLPLDYRSPWWAAVGDQVRAAGCSISVYDPR
jgi:hypothetical protein